MAPNGKNTGSERLDQRLDDAADRAATRHSVPTKADMMWKVLAPLAILIVGGMAFMPYESLNSRVASLETKVPDTTRIANQALSETNYCSQVIDDLRRDILEVRADVRLLVERLIEPHQSKRTCYEGDTSEYVGH
jgi:hypothetical protein